MHMCLYDNTEDGFILGLLGLWGCLERGGIWRGVLGLMLSSEHEGSVESGGGAAVWGRIRAFHQKGFSPTGFSPKRLFAKMAGSPKTHRLFANRLFAKNRVLANRLFADRLFAKTAFRQKAFRQKAFRQKILFEEEIIRLHVGGRALP